MRFATTAAWLLGTLGCCASTANAAVSLPDPARLIKVITGNDSMLLSDWQRARHNLGGRYAECALLYDVLSTAPSKSDDDLEAASRVFMAVAEGMLFELDKYEFKGVLLTQSQELERAHDQADPSATMVIAKACEDLLTDAGAQQAWFAARMSDR